MGSGYDPQQHQGAPPPPPAPQGYTPPPPGTTPPPVYRPDGRAADQHPNAVIMLVLAIVGLTGILTPIPGVVAFFMARNALNETPNCGMTKASYWLGVVSTIFMVLWVLGCLAYIGFIIFMFTAMGAASGGSAPPFGPPGP